jgi:hypothetical protein
MKFLKEPFLHFIVLGCLIFALYSAFGPNDEDGALVKEEINVSVGKVEQLSAIFLKTWQRPPTRDELQGLIDDYILEEAYTRMAAEMGLDKDDTVIRRRLRQKMEFLTADVAALSDPSDEELAAYLAANPEDFREDPRFDFQQIYFNLKKLGDTAKDVLGGTLAKLRAGEAIEGHPTLLPNASVDTPLRDIARNFGNDFAEQIPALPSGEWQGPLRSSFGAHFVLIDKIIPGRLPELDQVRQAVSREWANERKQTMTAKFNQELLDRYRIEIQWPDASEPKS